MKFIEGMVGGGAYGWTNQGMDGLTDGRTDGQTDEETSIGMYRDSQTLLYYRIYSNRMTRCAYIQFYGLTGQIVIFAFKGCS